METTQAIAQKYATVIDDLKAVSQQRLAMRPPTRPVRPFGAAVDIDGSPQSRELDLEETRLVGLLKMLEDEYQQAGGNVSDLHALAR